MHLASIMNFLRNSFSKPDSNQHIWSIHHCLGMGHTTEWGTWHTWVSDTSACFNDRKGQQRKSWQIVVSIQFSTGHLSPLPTAIVNITEDPRATGPVLVGERAVFTCRARSIPPPTITWFWFQNGMEVVLVDNGDDITSMSQSQPEDSFTTRSVLSVRVSGGEDFTEYFCVGDNGFDDSASDNATLVQAGMS